MIIPLLTMEILRFTAGTTMARDVRRHSRQALLASDAKALLGHNPPQRNVGGLTSFSITHRNVVEIYIYSLDRYRYTYILYVYIYTQTKKCIYIHIHIPMCVVHMHIWSSAIPPYRDADSPG